MNGLKMAKVLAIAGSPRKGGNSERLLDSFIEGAQAAGHAVEKVYAAYLNIAPCDEGLSCHKTGECRIKDDMQALYKKLLEADSLVISAPAFFMGVPAQLKCIIDRCQSLWAKRFVLNKPLRENGRKRSGFFLGASGLSRNREAFIGPKETIKAFFYVLGFSYKGEVLVEGVDKKGEMEKHKDALEEAYRLGKEAGIAEKV